MQRQPDTVDEQPRVVVAAAIVDDLDRPRTLLAARRSAPPSLAGRWEFPGGKMEPGESALAALDRELNEELGISAAYGPEIVASHSPSGWPLTVTDAGRSLVMRLWLARVCQGELTPREDHDELRAIDIRRWRELDWLPGDRPALAVLQRRCGMGFAPDQSPRGRPRR